MKKMLLPLLMFGLAVTIPAQEVDDLQKIGADFQKAGQEDDKIDAKEMDQFAARALKLAQTKKGKVGFDAAVWVFYVCNVGDEAKAEDKAKFRSAAMKVVLDNYAQSDRVGDIIGNYMNPRSLEEIDEFNGYVAEISAKSKSKPVQAASLWKRAELIDTLSMTERGQTEAEQKEMMAAYFRLRDEFGDVVNTADTGEKKRTFAECVKDPIFIAENLAVGKIAPDIKGTDQDGVEFKLSDYRGKVVLLDFWGHW